MTELEEFYGECPMCDGETFVVLDKWEQGEVTIQEMQCTVCGEIIIQGDN